MVWLEHIAVAWWQKESLVLERIALAWWQKEKLGMVEMTSHFLANRELLQFAIASVETAQSVFALLLETFLHSH